MANIVQSNHLIMVEQGTIDKHGKELNNNKFWDIERFDDNSFTTSWGRIGKAKQSETKRWSSEVVTIKEYERLLKSKYTKGYTDRKIVEGESHRIKTVSSSSVAQIAQEQIKTNSPETLNLVKYLADVNRHQITAHTNMTYDMSKGTYTTPLGEIVDQEAINESRILLTNIGDYVYKRDYSNSSFIKCVNQYLRYIPQDIGMRRLDVQSFFPDIHAVQGQNDILDALQASLTLVQSSDSNTNEPVKEIVFETGLYLITDSDIIKEVIKKYESGKLNMHTSSRYRIKRVFQVEISKMKSNFETMKTKIGGLHQFWHGTQASNLLSILKSGLMIPPVGSAHCTGRLFGNGLYFAPSSTKSLNYATGYWGGRSDLKTYMFLSDVLVGRYYTPSNTTENLPKPGYDSTWAKANVSGYIKNDEVIVYNTHQANLQYLVEFE